MSPQTPALLPTVEVATGTQPQAAVVWLHGLGADGHDFAGLVPELDLHGLPPLRFVFPHAPQRRVTINHHLPMPAWYDIFPPPTDGSPRPEDAEGIHSSAAQVRALIQREVARGIPVQRILLAGFSQGCALALHTGLRFPQRLAGVIGLSGYLPLADTLDAQRSAINQHTPVFLAHGSGDAVVVPQRGEDSCELLVARGYSVLWRLYPGMGHAVCPQEITDIGDFLRHCLV